MRPRAVAVELAWHTGMLVTSLIVLVPIVFLVLGSFKTVQQFFAAPYGLPASFDFFKYTKAWSEARISTTFVNSVMVTGGSVLISTALSCLGAYGLARFAFRMRGVIRLLFIGGLVVPVQLIMLPLFVLLRQVGLLGTLPALIVVYSVFGIPLGVLILVGFFATLPRDLEEAARIDGAGHGRVFTDVMLPLMRPAIAAVVILKRGVDLERLLHRPGAVHQAGHPHPARWRDELLRDLFDRVGAHFRQRHDLDSAGSRRLSGYVATVHLGPDRRRR